MWGFSRLSSLTRDNKVLTRKVLSYIKKWLSKTEIQLCGHDVHTYFQTDFFKMNTMYSVYSQIYVHTLPDDSFITIEDTDRVLIGIDFDKVLYKNNIAIYDYMSNFLWGTLHFLALKYFNTVMYHKVTRENDSYTKLIKELKEVFGFVIDSGINNGRNDELVNLLGMYNNSTAELSDERDRLLVCIANYLEEQVDNAVDDLVHRMYISNAEIQDRNRVLVIANLDFKKNRFTMYDSSKPSSKWKIVKGAKNNPMSFDLSEAIGNLRGVRTRSLQVDIGFSNVSNYKDNTLYLI